MASSPQYRAEEGISGSVAPGFADPIREMASYRALVSRTVEAFGDEIRASLWLSIPNQDLGGQTPLEVVQRSGYEMRPLEPILTRIEHGVDYAEGAFTGETNTPQTNQGEFPGITTEEVPEMEVPEIHWHAPDPIPYGTPLGANQLNATASVPGKFEYTPSRGYVLSKGTHTIWVTFIPADPKRYSPAQATVSLTILEGKPVDPRRP